MGFIYQAISNSITTLFLWLLRIYRYFVSPCLGNHCRFYPSCSEYAQQALLECSLISALWFIIRRILRCHPFHSGGYDPLLISVKKKSNSFRVKSAMAALPKHTTPQN